MRRRDKDNRLWVGYSDEDFFRHFMRAHRLGWTNQQLADRLGMLSSSCSERASKMRAKMKVDGHELPKLKSARWVAK